MPTLSMASGAPEEEAQVMMMHWLCYTCIFPAQQRFEAVAGTKLAAEAAFHGFFFHLVTGLCSRAWKY